MKSIVAIHRQYGNPCEVLKAEEIELASPKANEVTIKLLRASINPSDLGMIGGTYGRLRELPAIAGREGVGEVVEVGADVKNVKAGDIVRIPDEIGVWQQYQNADAKNLMILPKGLSLDMLAMSFVNPPTALCILKEFENLKEGDWFIQNGAGSALGYFMIQLCAHRGIKTINILRNAKAKFDDLKAIGADLIFDEETFNPKELKELTNGGNVKLGLNQIGGNSVSNMIKAMGQSATIATVGAMTSDAIRFPTRFLIFNDLRLRGFWWDKWQRTHSKDEVKAIFDEIFELVAKGILKAPVDEIFELKDIEKAMARATQNGRKGKVMLKF